MNRRGLFTGLITGAAGLLGAIAGAREVGAFESCMVPGAALKILPPGALEPVIGFSDMPTMPEPGDQVWYHGPSGRCCDLIIVPVVGASQVRHRAFVGFNFGPAVWWATDFRQLVAIDPGTAFGWGHRHRIDPALGTPLTAPPAPGTVVAFNTPANAGQYGCWAIVVKPPLVTIADLEEDQRRIAAGMVLAAPSNPEGGGSIIMADVRDMG